MRLNFNNTSRPQILDVAVDADDTTLVVQGSTSSFPPAPFVLSIERGEVQEEAVLCVEVLSPTEFSVIRGYDGTTPQLHSPGALIEHTTVARNYREAGIVRIDETERDSLEGDELWEGRVIYNTDSGNLEVAQEEVIDSLGDPEWTPILPIGAVIEFAGSVLPSNWLWANGGSHLKADWPKLDALLAAAGYPFGSDETHFTVPDRRERTGIGVHPESTNSDVQTLGGTGGQIDHTHTGPSHTHTGPSHTHTGPSHSHSNPDTGSDGSHAHSQPNTGSSGSHSHSNSATGNAQVGGIVGSTGDEGLVSKTDIDHNHSQGNTGSDSHSHSTGSDSHSHGGTTGTTSGHLHGISSDSHSHSVGSDSHSHSNPNTGTYSGSGSAHLHTHNLSSTASGGSHSHTTSNTNSGGSHTHSQGDTGSAGTGATGAAGTGATGASGTGETSSANFPFIAMNYIIRAA